MRKLLLLLFLLPVFGKAQKRVDEYKAPNGITYHERDTLKLNRGSAPETGNYRFVEIGGLARSTNPNMNGISKGFNGTNLIIKKILIATVRGAERYYFVTTGAGLSNFYVYVDDAIETCEVSPCKKDQPKTVSSVADEILKLKQLLDAGAINQAEFDSQKKKLLN